MIKRKRESGYWKCCVDQCPNNSRMMSFHVFPQNRAMALVWMSKLNVPNGTDFEEKYWKKRVCHTHFLVLQVEKHETYQIYNEHSYSYVGSIEKHKKQYINLQIHVHALERENTDLKLKLNDKEKYKSMERCLEDPYLLNFYTGFKDPKKYTMFSNIIIQQGKMSLQQINPRSKESLLNLDFDTQLFIVLSRLRVGLLVVDLGNKYNVSPATITTIFRFWINVIYVYFKQIPIWASDQLIKENLPDCFKKKYHKTRLILDATEIFIQIPGDCIVQSSTYSEYKSHNTAKGLIGMSPNGFITFISELYPGRVSDKEIVLLSGILSKLEPGWGVMADRGFTIEKELRNVGCDLNIPPFAQSSNQFQFNEEQEQRTRDIASTRIHIERIIRNVKRFRILHGNVPNTICDQLNQIWFICCMINNFTDVPLLDRQGNK